MRKLNVFLILFLFLFISCTKEPIKKSEIKEEKLISQVVEAYEEGMKALKAGDVLFAALKFNEAEILFPQSSWAPRSALMASYSYYSQDYYLDAIAELERFLRIYPKHKNIDYAYYLLSLCYYEQIVDEKKDLKSITKSKQYFAYILENFPNSDYAKDVNFKINYIDDILASKEMYIGRYYLERKKWIPAINRFKNILDYYDTTIYVEEALYRLVEVYYLLGLEQEAKKYAQLLGYNYQSSYWYKKSYSFFDKLYSENYKLMQKDKNKKTNKIIKKFKSIFD
ncbi:outer membrane protein assembly factor BamD [Candidatus Pelagibacter communis]|uniref:outer membrane protein assembly factor BamD n=1 Tax=Pelagibacter ubique TaxID=198252 RepID=UPI000A3F6C88|nr:outer membrane protein assembly factor BamD [Candidatus Pelagibacter ubique]